MTETPNEPDEVATPDESYLVADEDSDFDPEDSEDTSAEDVSPFVEREVQDDGSE